jgi:D-alanyl-D-alanine endopeptidase (penicillin-binding protein 7)
MYEVSRFSRAIQDMPQRIKRDSRTWLLACALSVAGMALAPVAQAKAPASKTAKTAKSAKTSAAGKKQAAAAKPGRAATKSAAASKGRAAPVKQARGKAARAGTAVAKAGPKNRKAVAENRVRTVSMAKSARVVVPARLSFAERAGLGHASDPLGLAASAALVMDQDTHEVLLSKNERAVLPIASITKLMTGLLVSEAKQPLDEIITITEADVDTLKGTRSRLPVGTQLSRGELLHLALMSSENRAANALGRNYPGGLTRFVSAMNAKAALLGMRDTHYVEPTGLSNQNQSSPADLARLVAIAARDPLLSALTTSPGFEVALGNHFETFNNTNRLVHEPTWNIGLQKTGYISEAGQCLVMQSRVNGRNLVMVFLDSNSRSSRIADAQRVRKWVEEQGGMTLAHKS